MNSEESETTAQQSTLSGGSYPLNVQCTFAECESNAVFRVRGRWGTVDFDAMLCRDCAEVPKADIVEEKRPLTDQEVYERAE